MLIAMEVHPPAMKTSWCNILKSQVSPPSKKENAPLDLKNTVESCKSSSGISIAVVDANAIIQGNEKLSRSADRFVSISEVMAEVRDPVSRHRLAFLPFTIDIIDPSPSSLKKVVDFARATGDLHTLSKVDLKLIALAYTLEERLHGIGNLRVAPPPLNVVNVKRLPEKDMPGWGDNVSNLEEWEALEKCSNDVSVSESRILPLKSISLESICNNEISSGGAIADNLSKNKPEKKVVAGVSFSQGEGEEDSGGDWCPVVSRSRNKRYFRGKASLKVHTNEEGNVAEENDGEEFSDETFGDTNEEGSLPLECTIEAVEEEMSGLVLTSGTDEGANESLRSNCEDEKRGEKPGSLSKSSVACVTGDFAMQNVILQMGLRLLAPEGMQVHKLHRWVLKCHACNSVTVEVGRLFCPKCGNGGTLRKVSVTVDEGGVVLTACRPRVTLRGTKFSLPLPRGGRNAFAVNPVLREDQLPHHLLYPKTKKPNKEEDDLFLSSDSFRIHNHDKKAAFRAPVGRAVALFTGKWNPNDNHFSRSRRR